MANTPPVPKLTVTPNRARTTTDSGNGPSRPAADSSTIATVMHTSAVNSQWIRGE
jgi:hypothetical protein